ncbi:hypothetical protein [Actinokineospora enzanensis]|uniref:hypothetical protein n=1 Tax=Actinokineospora enzanensis TaxID=155975 RepID=UPI00036FDAC0|nr:hypothetical protein [Actinokineospora enzanensis]
MWWVLVERLGEHWTIVESHKTDGRQAADELARRLAREFKPRMMMRVQQRSIWRAGEDGYFIQVDGLVGTDYFRVLVAELVERLDGRGNPVS